MITGFFTDNPYVQAAGTEYLRTLAFFYVFLTAMFMANGLLRGAGDAMIPMIITVFTMWVIRIPLAFILSRDWTTFDIYYNSFLGRILPLEWEGLGSLGIWMGAPISWVIGFLMAYAYYRTGRWKKKLVTSN
jgi:Na+-driven multidrug efflux pump